MGDIAGIGASLGPSIGLSLGAGMGAVGAATPGTGTPSAAATGTAAPAGGAAKMEPPSAVVTISQAAIKALSEAPQVGANFSVSQDASGHQYVGGMDASGFHAPSSMSGSSQNVNGQSMESLNGGQDLLVAETLLFCMAIAQDGEKAAAAAFGVNTKAVNAYAEVSAM
ncbi:MAG: hypothetical protein Q7S87_09125 [Agitococcus sp.]|nr:hypothetical protein [Agitococcus sp.]MDO9177063.1 hypothetical protein [Agitococcus sp.]